MVGVVLFLMTSLSLAWAKQLHKTQIIIGQFGAKLKYISIWGKDVYIPLEHPNQIMNS